MIPEFTVNVCILEMYKYIEQCTNKINISRKEKPPLRFLFIFFLAWLRFIFTQQSIKISWIERHSMNI